MKTALVTTTIRVPHVLALYRQLGQSVRIFVAGDHGTPDAEVRALLDGLGDAVYLGAEDQQRLGYECSDPIGWHTLARRNIATLEAIRWGAEVVVTIDDDNIPFERTYFEDFRRLFTGPFDGLAVNTESGWFDAGAMLEPVVGHRGFPYEHRHTGLRAHFKPVTGVNVGVAAGLWLGDPDIDAIERLVARPWVRATTDLARAGVIVAPGCYAPFNTQNTAFCGQLAPLLMVLPGVGRYEDIWASYIAERVMAATRYRVHFGGPFVFQERNQHDLWRDLRAEQLGMEIGTRFAEDLGECEVTGDDLLADLRSVYSHLRTLDYVPSLVSDVGDAWCADVERARGG
jgi:hypothetical protein